MSRLHARVLALETYKEKENNCLQGSIDVLRGQRPIDALQNAEPGLWLLIDEYVAWAVVGRMSRNGKREILFGEGNMPS